MRYRAVLRRWAFRPQNCVTTDRDRVDDSAESIVVDWPNQESSPPAIWPRNATQPVEIPAWRKT
jgi:hypothetical protein